ncbi:unnamed protein product [Cylindrotheca closterium]|uniref:Uncharacterized protein n=1 Tax=Cylindrotheca closterium TaxID=2856 RepID=A0AAD2JKY2_9STRA|nr:unnamed protein product [Cylindrotheca closterium]
MMPKKNESSSPTMLQEVFDKLESRSRGALTPPRSNVTTTADNNATPAKRYQTSNNGAFEVLDTLDRKNRSTTHDLDPLAEGEDFGSLSADEADTGDDGIIRSSRKRVQKARFAYREDPEYWTGRRGSTILQRGRRRSSMMYPQVKETADSAALACSLMI